MGFNLEETFDDIILVLLRLLCLHLLTHPYIYENCFVSGSTRVFPKHVLRSIRRGMDNETGLVFPLNRPLLIRLRVETQKPVKKPV